MQASYYEDSEQLFAAAADEVVAAAEAAHQNGGRFVWGIPGGSTPRKLFRRLIQEDQRGRISWRGVWTFVVDERLVPLADERSNMGTAIRQLLDPVKVPDANTLRPQTGDPECAQQYEASVRSLIEHHSLDLLVLGMGTDGHIASLFPGSPALFERRAWFVKSEAPVEPHARITATVPLLAAAARILVIVGSNEKQEATRLALCANLKDEVTTLPARVLWHVPGNVRWMVLGVP